MPDLCCHSRMLHGWRIGSRALACHVRMAAPNSVFGHRGAALGLITGWGGTQRLPRLVGKGNALEMLVAAEKIHAAEAQRIGLVDLVSHDPVEEALRRIGRAKESSPSAELPRPSVRT